MPGVPRLQHNPPHGGFLRFWRTESPIMPHDFRGWERLIYRVGGAAFALSQALDAIERIAEHHWFVWFVVISALVIKSYSTRR